MIKQISKRDLLWGYLAQFLNIGSGIIIVPVALKYLSTEDIGLWYLFIAIASLAQLVEFGFQPTISRMVSYVYSGASELKSEGVPDITGSINYQMLYDLIESSKYIYRYVAFVVAVVLLIFGSLYLNTFQAFKEKQLFAWVLFTFATVINFYYTYFNGLMIGKGSQSTLYRITAISKVLMLITAIPLLVIDYGLISMALGTLVSIAFTRGFLYIYFNNKEQADIKALNEIKEAKASYIKIVWLSAWKLGLTSIGAFLILRVNQFIVSSYLGLKVAASYGLTVQIIGIISSVSSMYFILNIPKITSLQSVRNREIIWRIVKKSYFFVHVLYVFGCVALVLVGIPILDFLKVNTSLVPMNLLTVMLIMYGLELNHSISATFLTTLNQVPFLYSSIISGIFIVLVSLSIAKFTMFGVVGIVLGQLIIQALYNNWYWPFRVWKELKNDN